MPYCVLPVLDFEVSARMERSRVWDCDHFAIRFASLVDMCVASLDQELGDVLQLWKSQQHVTPCIHRVFFADEVPDNPTEDQEMLLPTQSSPIAVPLKPPYQSLAQPVTEIHRRGEQIARQIQSWVEGDVEHCSFLGIDCETRVSLQSFMEHDF